MKLILTGGKARKNNNILKDWNTFESGIMIIYDLQSKTVVDRLEYVTPDKNKPSKDSSVLFKTCHFEEGLLYIPTKTEILIYDIKKKEIINLLSHPLMNDLHHVFVKENNLFAVSTGLDSILIFNRYNLRFKDIFFVGEGHFRDRFKEDIDYRKVESLKPHECHPNYIFNFCDDLYITRLQQRDCKRMSDKKVFNIADNFIHDGVVSKGKIFFTSVDGKLIITNLSDNKQVIDLNELQDHRIPLGWCRGVMPIDASNVMIGFSILRNTKIKENIKWVYSKFYQKNFSPLRTRISLYNFDAKDIIKEIFLDDYGIDAIFGINRYYETL